MRLVPEDFAVPEGLHTDRFVLEPLGAHHSLADYRAWTSSIEHIRSTPGFAGSRWPAMMTLEENTADLARHAADFAARTGFTYTVLEPGTRDVIGCLYLYPPRREGYDVDVRSWVRADRAELDEELYDVVERWISDTWPFSRPDYAARRSGGADSGRGTSSAEGPNLAG